MSEAEKTVAEIERNKKNKAAKVEPAAKPKATIHMGKNKTVREDF